MTRDTLLDYPTSVIISWSGMRGIVSLAIAIGLPETLENGAPFPLRNEIIFISSSCIIYPDRQGLTLPLIVKMMSKYKRQNKLS
ncbi:hypothetical protein [Chitinophaga pinensis]|uniref:hypothetical protein n=1 Tax=Chitinophaga pinensis TaxID=79329 RepID=UPI001645F3FB|nr:hypothetical protein [Chitinophaga pinensis]